MISDWSHHSEQTKDLVAAIINFKAAVQKLDLQGNKKGGFGYYNTLEKIESIAQSLGAEFGLDIDQYTHTEGNAIYLITEVSHISGQWRRSVCYLCSTDLIKDDKSMKPYGCLRTYNRRYELSTLLGIGNDAPDPEETGAFLQEQKVQAKPVQQTLTNSPLSLQHQNEILKLIKSDADVLKMVCAQFKVSKLSDLKDAEYSTVLETAKFLAEQLGL